MSQHDCESHVNSCHLACEQRLGERGAVAAGRDGVHEAWNTLCVHSEGLESAHWSDLVDSTNRGGLSSLLDVSGKEDTLEDAGVELVGGNPGRIRSSPSLLRQVERPSVRIEDISSNESREASSKDRKVNHGLVDVGLQSTGKMGGKSCTGPECVSRSLIKCKTKKEGEKESKEHRLKGKDEDEGKNKEAGRQWLCGGVTHLELGAH